MLRYVLNSVFWCCLIGFAMFGITELIIYLLKLPEPSYNIGIAEMTAVLTFTRIYNGHHIPKQSKDPKSPRDES